jgi:hypothetical protein
MLTWKGLYELLKVETSRGPIPLFPGPDAKVTREFLLNVMRSLITGRSLEYWAVITAFCILTNPEDPERLIGEHITDPSHEGTRRGALVYYNDRENVNTLKYLISYLYTSDFTDTVIPLQHVMFRFSGSKLGYRASRPVIVIYQGRGGTQPVPSVFSGTILCRKAVITFLCIRRFRKKWKRVPKDVWDLIAKHYIYSSRRTPVWFPENMIPKRSRRKRIKTE